MNITHDTALVTNHFLDDNLFDISTYTPWFSNMANYLISSKFPRDLYVMEKHKIVQLSSNYSFIEGDIYHIRPDIIMRRCVWEDEMYYVLKAFHCEPYGGNFADKMTT